MLQIRNLSVNVGDKNVLNDITIDIKLGHNYTILGKNGSGKSSLLMTLMGNPKYKMTAGDIVLDGESIAEMTPDKRAAKGIFLAFQNIPEIPGVKVFDFLKAIYNAHNKEQIISFLKFKKIIEPIVATVGLDKDFLYRDLNVGFSGGEKRKLEIIQMKLLEPKYIFLDEIDSGLDINAIKDLGQTLKSLQASDRSFIVVSHYFEILDYIDIHEVIVMGDGQVQSIGDVGILENIKNKGF